MYFSHPTFLWTSALPPLQGPSSCYTQGQPWAWTCSVLHSATSFFLWNFGLSSLLLMGSLAWPSIGVSVLLPWFWWWSISSTGIFYFHPLNEFSPLEGMVKPLTYYQNTYPWGWDFFAKDIWTINSILHICIFQTLVEELLWVLC